jgi:hypothetical protein
MERGKKATNNAWGSCELKKRDLKENAVHVNAMHDSFSCIVCSFARKNRSRIGATGLPFTSTSSWFDRLPGLQKSGGDENNNITNHLISLTDALIFFKMVTVAPSPFHLWWKRHCWRILKEMSCFFPPVCYFRIRRKNTNFKFWKNLIINPNYKVFFLMVRRWVKRRLGRLEIRGSKISLSLFGLNFEKKWWISDD